LYIQLAQVPKIKLNELSLQFVKYQMFGWKELCTQTWPKYIHEHPYPNQPNRSKKQKTKLNKKTFSSPNLSFGKISDKKTLEWNSSYQIEFIDTKNSFLDVEMWPINNFSILHHFSITFPLLSQTHGLKCN
jgi:hypothetical protein